MSWWGVINLNILYLKFVSHNPSGTHFIDTKSMFQCEIPIMVKSLGGTCYQNYEGEH